MATLRVSRSLSLSLTQRFYQPSRTAPLPPLPFSPPCTFIRSQFHSSSHLRMKGARVTSWGAPPEYIDVPDLPSPSPDQLQLKVVAAGVPRAVKGRAAGIHPSAHGKPLPYDPSVDGVGLDESTGDLYFINSLAAPIFTERANVARDQLFKLDPDTDPVSVAAHANPTASSWMALRCRALGGCEGRTVAILGATSASGRAGAFVARQLGAAKIVGLSRNAETLAAVEHLDERVVLPQDGQPLTLPASVGPVHIVLDWIGGPVGIDFLRAAEIQPGQNLQYIQVGGLAGYTDIVVPARLINVKPIYIMASGVGSLSLEDLKREMAGLAVALCKIKKPFVDILAAPMSEVRTVWETEETKRLVLVP